MNEEVHALDSHGVSPIVAEVILIGMIIVALGGIAAKMVSEKPTPRRSVTLGIRLENTADSRVVRVIVMHEGGSSIPKPRDSDEGLLVMGGKSGWAGWENRVPSDNWELSDPSYGLQFAENMVGYLRHADANVSAGDSLWITVTDRYADKIVIDRRTYTVQEP